jgi:ABC-type multidrug transport system fused ATPase/permease subunit
MAASAGLLARAVSTAATDGRPPASAAVWLGSFTAPTLAYVSLIAAFVKAGGSALLAHAEKRVASAVANRLRGEVVATFLGNHTAPPAPPLLATLSVGLREVETSVSAGVLAFVRSVAQLAPLGVCLLLLSSEFALVAVLLATPFAFGLSLLRRRARRAQAKAQSLVAELERGVDELVRNADLFRTHGAGERALEEARRAGDLAGRAGALVERDRALLSGGNEVLAALAVVGLVAVLGRLGVGFPAAAALPFAAVFFMAYRPLRDLGDARASVMRGSVAVDAIRQSLGTAELPRAHHSPVRSDRPRAFLELDEFGATARGPTTSARVARGEIVALVGPTGSGKTTLIRALLGLESARGALFFDGSDVTGAPVGPATRPFAWVPQEAPLVTGTVLDNVRLFGGEERSAMDALDAIGARHLRATDDTVGPSGRPLSGGERRQVSLARALATGLPVLLLDEPTEGLDAEAARAVCDAIVRLRKTRTIIVATHREDVVAIADRVVTLGDARGAETLAAE